ncbi:MAG: hypothetical protein ACFFCZ_15255 [Promethearchaeota archaeon]
MDNQRIWKFVVVSLLIYSMIITGVAYVLFSENLQSLSNPPDNKDPDEITVVLIIELNIQNNTNTTLFTKKLTANSTMYDLLNQSVHLTGKWFHPFGFYVSGINNVTEDLSEGIFWFFYYWDYDSEKWVESPVGVSQFTLHHLSIVKMLYHKSTGNFTKVF